MSISEISSDRDIAVPDSAFHTIKESNKLKKYISQFDKAKTVGVPTKR